MNIRRTLGAALAAFGAILLYLAWNASQAPLEQVREALTGRYSGETMAYLIAGGISLAAGVMAFTLRR